MRLGQLWRSELRAFADPAILLIVFGGVLFYSFLYPLPYARQMPREQAVVVVNLDGSQLSRRLERMIDATPQVRIVGHAPSLAAAEKQMVAERLAGLLVIPGNFDRDLRLGRQPNLIFAGDASYFLVYGTILEGMTAAGKTLAAEVRVSRLVGGGQALVLAREQQAGVRLGLHPLFNETEGYTNYVIPAVFVLILHQTLLIAAGILGGGQNESRHRGEHVSSLECGAAALLLVRTGIFLAAYSPLLLYYFGPSFMLYDIPRLAPLPQLILLSIAFLLATCMAGITLGCLLPRRELATLIVLLSSLPIIFSCGFIWPTSSLPPLIVWLVQVLPVVPAISAFLRLNQMGAEFQQILPQLIQLGLQALVYGLFAWLLLRRQAQGQAAENQRQLASSTRNQLP